MEMSAEEFEGLVAQALDGIPAELTAVMDNCVILVEDDAPPELPGHARAVHGDPADRAGWVLHRAARHHPDLPVSRSWRPLRSDPDVVEQIRITVVHEIAHHFGIDDQRLHELGYG